MTAAASGCQAALEVEEWLSRPACEYGEGGKISLPIPPPAPVSQTVIKPHNEYKYSVATGNGPIVSNNRLQLENGIRRSAKKNTPENLIINNNFRGWASPHWMKRRSGSY